MNVKEFKIKSEIPEVVRILERGNASDSNAKKELHKRNGQARNSELQGQTITPREETSVAVLVMTDETDGSLPIKWQCEGKVKWSKWLWCSLPTNV